MVRETEPDTDDGPSPGVQDAALALADLAFSAPPSAATNGVSSDYPGDPSLSNGAGSGEDDERALVLVVEDNPDMRAFIAESLATRYRVVTAPDGQVGFERAISLRPDLILSDIMMPKVGGEQCRLTSVASCGRRSVMSPAAAPLSSYSSAFGWSEAPALRCSQLSYGARLSASELQGMTCPQSLTSVSLAG